jgi:hypothetical protein
MRLWLASDISCWVLWRDPLPALFKCWLLGKTESTFVLRWATQGPKGPLVCQFGQKKFFFKVYISSNIWKICPAVLSCFHRWCCCALIKVFIGLQVGSSLQKTLFFIKNIFFYISTHNSTNFVLLSEGVEGIQVIIHHTSPTP